MSYVSLLMTLYGVGFGYIWAKGFNPKAAARNDRDRKLGAWFRGRVEGAVKTLGFCGDGVQVSNRTIWTHDKQPVEVTIRVGGEIEPIQEVVAETRL